MIDDEPIGARESDPDIIDLDGVRIQRGWSPARRRQCPHGSITYNEGERRIWCEECKSTLEGFDAFMHFVRSFERIATAARLKLAEADEALRATVRRRATRVLDQAWASSRGLQAVCCPHCRKGLLPEDFADQHPTRTSREYELARRAREKPP